MLQVLRGLLVAGIAAAVAAFPLHSETAAARALPPAAQIRGLEAHTYSERHDEGSELMVQGWVDQVNGALAAAEAQRRAEEEARQRAEAEAAAAAAAAASAAAAATRAQAPAQAPPAPTRDYGVGPIQDMIRQVFAPYGPGAVDWGLRVAACESGYNPRAYNGSGPYYGLFQFSMSTFQGTIYGNQDIWDPFYNASAAAWKYSVSGGGAWGCK